MIILLSGPSGVGKSTLAANLLQRHPQLRVSISHTTRPLRGKERDGVHYYFVSVSEFAATREAGGFAESAEVFGNWYGTARATLEAIAAEECDALLDIDYQGAQQIRKVYPDAVAILLAPPSLAVLERRLRGRGTESEEQLTRRLEKARLELSHYADFDYVVVNGSIAAASDQLDAIVLAEQARTSRQGEFLRNLIDS